jgi:hypothetical protein
MTPEAGLQQDESGLHPHPDVSCLAISAYRLLTDWRICSEFFLSMAQSFS